MPSLFALLWRARMIRHAHAASHVRHHRTRQESTAPRLWFSCDLAVARPPAKVVFANTHLILGVLLEQHEQHEQKNKHTQMTTKQHFLVAFASCTKKNPKSPFLKVANLSKLPLGYSAVFCRITPILPGCFEYFELEN